MIKLGETNITSVKLGDSNIPKIYQGETLIMGGSTPDPWDFERGLRFEFTGATSKYQINSNWTNVNESPYFTDFGHINLSGSNAVFYAVNDITRFKLVNKLKTDGSNLGYANFNNLNTSLIEGELVTTFNKLYSFGEMFNGCINLESMTIECTDESTMSIAVNNMFNNCSKLKTLIFKNLVKFTCSSYGSMIQGTPELADIVLINCDQTSINTFNTIGTYHSKNIILK